MSMFVDKKFINMVSSQLERFAWKKEDLANCRCPICGDSTKKKTKARFYDFSDQLINGEIKNPTAIYMESRTRAKFAKLLRLKKSFKEVFSLKKSILI